MKSSMRILIDIGHPAHVHYFRNFIKIMESKGHHILVTARNRDVIHDLLKHYNIRFINRGKGAKSLLGKLIYSVWADLLILYWSIRFRPDVFLSHGSHYAAHVAWLLRRSAICTGDSDHIKVNAKILIPYIDTLITPLVYTNNYGDKHIRFNGYTELLHLHPKYFTPDYSILNKLGISINEPYFILRFVSWNAFHDVVPNSLNNEFIEKIINMLLPYGRIIISSEKKLPEKFAKYQVSFPAHELHNILSGALMYIGEGATTASEAAILGTPSIYINPLSVSYCTDLELSYGLCFNYKTVDGVLERINELLKLENLKGEFKKKRDAMLSDKVSVTDFLVWFIENYPGSHKILKANPDSQAWA